MESNLNTVVVVVVTAIIIIIIIVVVVVIVVVVIINIVSCLQAHNIPLQMSRSGSVLTISGVGRWIDRGLSKLMGGPEQPPQSGPGSTGSTQSEMDPYVAKSKHRRNTSDQHLGSDTPKVGEDPVKIVTKIILMMTVIMIMPVITTMMMVTIMTMILTMIVIVVRTGVLDLFC